ncbi:hypothetical protein BHE74_00041878 [Ensete ventricosum]|nr:hypothetical protein BHE74_00041878 [Ensete ventricosum]
MLQQRPPDGVTIGRGRRRGGGLEDIRRPLAQDVGWVVITEVGSCLLELLLGFGGLVAPLLSSSRECHGRVGFPSPKAPSFQAEKEKWGSQGDGIKPVGGPNIFTNGSRARARARATRGNGRHISSSSGEDAERFQVSGGHHGDPRAETSKLIENALQTRQRSNFIRNHGDLSSNICMFRFRQITEIDEEVVEKKDAVNGEKRICRNRKKKGGVEEASDLGNRMRIRSSQRVIDRSTDRDTEENSDKQNRV